MNSSVAKSLILAAISVHLNAIPALPQQADGRNGLCGTPDQIAAVQAAEGYSVLFYGQSTASGENTLILGDEAGTSYAVILTYPEEWCIVFSGTDYQTFNFGEFGN